MAEVPGQVESVVQDYVRKISEQIPITKALLFGSYAKGTFHPDSDIDIAIFSSFFDGMDRVQATKFLLLQALDYRVDLEPISFTDEEYYHPVGIVSEILRTGIEVK